MTGDDGSVCMELNTEVGDGGCSLAASFGCGTDILWPDSLPAADWDAAFSFAFGLSEEPKVETNSGTTRSISFFEGFFDAIKMCRGELTLVL